MELQGDVIDVAGLAADGPSRPVAVTETRIEAAAVLNRPPAQPEITPRNFASHLMEHCRTSSDWKDLTKHMTEDRWRILLAKIDMLLSEQLKQHQGYLTLKQADTHITSMCAETVLELILQSLVSSPQAGTRYELLSDTLDCNPGLYLRKTYRWKRLNGTNVLLTRNDHRIAEIDALVTVHTEQTKMLLALDVSLSHRDLDGKKYRGWNMLSAVKKGAFTFVEGLSIAFVSVETKERMLRQDQNDPSKVVIPAMDVVEQVVKEVKNRVIPSPSLTIPLSNRKE